MLVMMAFSSEDQLLGKAMVLVDVLLENVLGAKDAFPFNYLNDIPYAARSLLVHLTLELTTPQ